MILEFCCQPVSLGNSYFCRFTPMETDETFRRIFPGFLNPLFVGIHKMKIDAVINRVCKIEIDSQATRSDFFQGKATHLHRRLENRIIGLRIAPVGNLQLDRGTGFSVNLVELLF